MSSSVLKLKYPFPASCKEYCEGIVLRELGLAAGEMVEVAEGVSVLHMVSGDSAGPADGEEKIYPGRRRKPKAVQREGEHKTDAPWGPEQLCCTHWRWL